MRGVVCSVRVMIVVSSVKERRPLSWSLRAGLRFLRHVGVSPIAAMKPHCGYDSE